MRSQYRHVVVAATLAAAFVSNSAMGRYVPDRLFIAPRTDFDSIPDSTLSINGISGFATIPIPNTLVVEETNMVAVAPPSGEPGGVFERNEHVMRFLTATEAACRPATRTALGTSFSATKHGISPSI